MSIIPEAQHDFDPDPALPLWAVVFIVAVAAILFAAMIAVGAF